MTIYCFYDNDSNIVSVKHYDDWLINKHKTLIWYSIINCCLRTFLKFFFKELTLYLLNVCLKLKLMHIETTYYCLLNHNNQITLEICHTLEATYVWTRQLCSPTQSTFQIDPLSSVAHILKGKIWLATWLTVQRENSLWTRLLFWV